MRLWDWRPAMAGALLVAGCTRVPRTPAAAGPVLVRLEPASVRMRDGEGAALVLSGSGFDATANTIAIGTLQLAQVPSRDNGTRIALVIPDRVSGAGGAPPMLWERGTVPVTVTTARGTSNALPLEVIP